MAATSLLARLRPQDPAQRLYVGFIGLLLLSGTAAALLEAPLGLALPVAGLGVGVLLVDWRWVYYALLLTLAFSREIPLPGGLSMDVPSEPLMLILLVCFGVSALLGRTGVPPRIWRHPLVIIMGPEEAAAGVVKIKIMQTGVERVLPLDEVVAALTA